MWYLKIRTSIFKMLGTMCLSIIGAQLPSCQTLNKLNGLIHWYCCKLCICKSKTERSDSQIQVHLYLYISITTPEVITIPLPVGKLRTFFTWSLFCSDALHRCGQCCAWLVPYHAPHPPLNQVSTALPGVFESFILLCHVLSVSFVNYKMKALCG